MSNTDLLIEAFKTALPKLTSDVTQARYSDHWDSLEHMVLTATIEDKFNIMFEIEEISAISSFEKAKEVLSTGHGVKF